MTWSAGQYSKFEKERNRPIHDLLAQVSHTEVASIADLGCGPGNSTELLIDRFPNAAVVGLDSSQAMIQAARRRLPGVRFEVDDIATWPDAGPFDLVFANASLQWVPDHATLLPFLFGKLAACGVLAVQIPDNLEEPAHRIMRETAARGSWSSKLTESSQARGARHSANWYYRELRSLGAEVNIWRTTYHHPLAGGATAIAEWFKGSGFQPFLDPLDAPEKAVFLARYMESIDAIYTTFEDGMVLLPFPRLFFVASRGGTSA